MITYIMQIWFEAKRQTDTHTARIELSQTEDRLYNPAGRGGGAEEEERRSATQNKNRKFIASALP